VWVVRAGRRGRFAADFHAAGTAAIGWGGFGDLAGRDRAELVAAARELGGERNAATTAGMLFRFANEIAVGDWVLMPVSARRELHAGRVTGPYEHRAGDRYPHVRPVAWEQLIHREELPPAIAQQLTSMLTVFRPSSQDDLREFLAGADD
jgi:predicted Mrr-cat superfamily restriction endonuclease